MSELQGVIASYFAERGFGFIAVDGGSGEQVFFHKRQLDSPFVVEGDKVTFDLAESKEYPGKMQAARVRVLR